MKFKILLLALFTSTCYCQSGQFPDGIYLNIEQLKNKTPIINTGIQVIRRSSGDIIINGGNDYKLKSDVDSLSKTYLRDEIIAYSINDSLFINCAFFRLQNWYALCLTKGNFLAFRSSMSYDAAAATVFFGGALAAGLSAKDRYLNVLSLRTGNVKDLTEEYLRKRLKENQSLLAQFNSENDHSSDSILIKYIDHLNEFILPTSQPPIDSLATKSKRKRN